MKQIGGVHNTVVVWSNSVKFCEWLALPSSIILIDAEQQKVHSVKSISVLANKNEIMVKRK